MSELTKEPIAESDTTESFAAMAEPMDTPSPDETTSDVTQRLAEEFLLLAEEFPQFDRPEQLPDGVLDLAAKKGISLLDAYLRYRLQEEKKVAAAAEMRRQAVRQSVGSLSRGAVETPPEQDAFLRAFRAAL